MHLPSDRGSSAPIRRALPLARRLDEALDGRCGGDLQGFVDALAAVPQGQGQPLPSLIIEEDPDDAFLLLRAFSLAACRGDVRIVDSLTDARRILAGAHYCPVLVVLSITPRIREVGPWLQWVRRQSRLRDVPILALLGASPPSEDMRQILDAPGVYWIVKPTEHERLATVLQKLILEAADYRSES